MYNFQFVAIFIFVMLFHYMFKSISKQQLPFWLITIAVMIGLTLPILVKDGMFMDAMLYASVSHNLSQGIGTFWFPQFSLRNMAGLSSFHEQPPLVFGIQALFYKILGNSMYTERIYTFITMCITAWLINLLWKETCRDEKIKQMGWLPILMWITMPVCFWSYAGDMQENTMGIFTLAAGIWAFRALKSEQLKVLQYLYSGLFIFLATFSKGVPGLFVVTMPCMYWLATRKIGLGRMVAATALILIVPVLLYGVLLLFPDSRESLSVYFFKRLLGRINDEPTVSSRFEILGHVFTEMLPQLGLIVVLFLITGMKKVKSLFQPNDKQMILFFTLVGFSGTLPLMLTLVQKDFYMLPAFPFFAIAFGIVIAAMFAKPILEFDTQSRGYKILKTISFIAIPIVLVISLAQIGKTTRNKEMLHDVYVIGNTVPRLSAITIPHSIWEEWDLQCYLIRYFNISVDPDKNYQYYLLDCQLHDAAPAGYKKLDLKLDRYMLYEKQ